MKKTKRSIVLHGPSTLTISLPSTWVKKHQLKKGDELTVVNLEKELRIYPEDIKNEEEKKIIDFGSEERVGKSSITGAYRQGYDTIEIKFNSPNYMHIIQEIINKQMIGFEIVEQKENSCTIKDLTGHAKDEFENVQRRIWLLVLDLSDECLKILKNRNKEGIEMIRLKDYTINKFTNYCLRHLLKNNNINQKKSTLLYYSIKTLEEIADSYKRLCLFSKDKTQFNEQEIKLIEELNKELKNFYNVWYSYDSKELEEIINNVKKIEEKIHIQKNNLTPLQITTSKITDLSSIKIQMNLK